MKNQTHNFYLSPIGVTDNGLKIAATSEDILRMYDAAKRTQQENNDISFDQICHNQAHEYVANEVQKNYPEYFDLYDFQEENCTYEISAQIEDVFGEWTQRHERENQEMHF
jgi:hypothetical protein